MRPHISVLSVVLSMFLLAGCSGGKESSQNSESAGLQGPQIVKDMIAAHGGMEIWKNAPTVAFTDHWGESPATRFVVEQNTRRAYFDVIGTHVSAAWDGEKAWSVNWPSQSPVRFLMLLNYYFLNLPWLTQDPGVILGEPGTGTLPGDDTEYVTVMMTFEPGTGDTPDDYYRLYIDPKTKMLHACDYIVTYRTLMDAGQTSTPEHCLVYDTMTTVDGLQLPAHFTIYEGERTYASCTLTDYSLNTPFDSLRMTMPEGAVVDTSTP